MALYFPALKSSSLRFIFSTNSGLYGDFSSSKRIFKAFIKAFNAANFSLFSGCAISVPIVQTYKNPIKYPNDVNFETMNLI